jgi:hypothetical protein
VGPINFQSWVTVTRKKGRPGEHFALFWSEEGPMLLVQVGTSPPSLMSLSQPLLHMLRGTAYQGALGLSVSRFDKVEAEWVSDMNEVRFAVSADGGTKHTLLLCVDMDSVVAFAADPENNYPYWRIRDNEAMTSFPVSTLFIMRVDPTTGLPSVTGQPRCFCAQDGSVYEMDALDSCKDEDLYPISFLARRDGYDGYEDGIREHEKSAQKIFLRATQHGDYNIYARLTADGGRMSSETSITLNQGLTLWTDDPGIGQWGDGGKWNTGEFVTDQGGFGCLGQKFDLELYDNGEIEAPVAINSWTLLGQLEDRR